MKKKLNHTSYSFLNRFSTLITTLPFLFFCSCSLSVKDNTISLDVIEEYLGTKKVQLLYSGSERAIIMTKLSEVGLNPTEDTNTQINTLSSVVALALSKELLEKKPEIKYITVRIDDVKMEYQVEDLKAVNNYLKVIEQYFKLIQDNRIDTGNIYLSEQIPLESQESFRVYLEQSGTLKNYRLINYQVVNGKLQVLIRMVFNEGKSLPFAFIFLLDDDDRIDGIQPV